MADHAHVCLFEPVVDVLHTAGLNRGKKKKSSCCCLVSLASLLICHNTDEGFSKAVHSHKGVS